MRQIRCATAGLLTAAVAAFPLGCDRPEPASPEWAQFRGPGGTAISSEEGLPVHWDGNGGGVRWTADISSTAGVSSPIVSRWQVFVTGEAEGEDDTTLRVLSLDLRTGEKLWETDIFSREREDFPMRSVNNTPAGPSPATDGEHVFAYFGTHLAALDFEGDLVWLQEVDPLYLEEVYYGAGSSLILTDDHVIVFRDREKVEPSVVGWLAAFEKKTGKRAWRRKWTDTCCSYTTPVLYDSGSGTEILVVQAGRLAAFDAESGKRLWDEPQQVNQPVASPALSGDLVCSASGAHGVKNLTCWRLRTNKKGNTRAMPLWASPRGISSIASPVIYNGLLFTITDNGVMYCFDPESGKTRWTHRLEKGAYSASLIAGDGKIYAFSRWGSASVIAASPEFQLLAANALPQVDVVATPAIADGCLLVRTKDHLTCIEGAEAPEAAAG